MTGRVAVVTGAGGFAGTWLCRELRAAGREVHGWVRRPVGQPVAGVRYQRVDLRDGPAIHAALCQDNPHEVYHLGALSSVGACARDPDRATLVNVDSTGHLLAALPPEGRLLLASSCHVYGSPRTLPLREEHSLHPRSHYGRTKQQAESLVLRAAASGRHAIVARAFHHTGPGQDRSYALADWAWQIGRRRRLLAAGQPAPPVQTGDLSLRRDFSDVRDIVAGYRLLLERAPAGAVVQLCSGQAPSLRELLGKLNHGVMPPTDQVATRLRADDIAELRGDPGLAESMGWSRRYSMDQCLSELMAATAGGC